MDYSAHVGEAFVVSKKQSKNLRVINALERMGSSVFNGAFSTFLAFAETYILLDHSWMISWINCFTYFNKNELKEYIDKTNKTPALITTHYMFKTK